MLHRISQALMVTIVGLATLVLSFLLWQLMHLRAYMPLTKIEDMTFQVQSPWFLVQILLGLLALVLLAHCLKKVSYKILFSSLAVIYLILGIWIISHADPLIRADAKHVFEAAKSLNAGDFSSLIIPTGYLYHHPHQLGLVSLERFYVLFSEDTRFIFSVNLLLVIGTLYYQTQLTKLLYGKEKVVIYQILLSFTCFPQLFFILFAYGAIPGTFLITFAYYQIINSSINQQKKTAISAILALSLAVTIRNNFQIMTLAFLVIWSLAYLAEKQKHYLVMMTGLVVTLFFMGKALTTSYEMTIGQPLSKGVPKIAYVTMGLQADPKGGVGGWWNTYNTYLLDKNNFDYQKAEAVAKTDLAKEVNQLSSDIPYAWSFFKEKALSTWLDPLFQSVWTGPLRQRNQETTGAVMKSIYEEGQGYVWLNHFGAVWLWLVYALSASYVFVKKKTHQSFLDCLPFVFFLGGFTFHLLWETKSQYVLVYVFFLIPPAAASLSYWIDTYKRKNQGT